MKIYCTFANEFKSFNFTVCVDAFKHRLKLSKGGQFTIGALNP
ncbi:hypothetical protein HMPREF9554_02640 [Treponema phagedenis F0421]|nr:hypothetical protein HMPREF9554_02640 [Treponema phagedenis F0421]